MSKHIVELAFEKNVPSDVLVEHLGYALRVFGVKDITIAGSQPDPEAERYHPFDGPEMFDDYVEATPETAFPNVTNIVNHLRREYKW